ncbi:MAG: 5'-methylthioadenosine/S-adenosylhomocysteine nucleosidase [Cellulomonas sp.]
MIAVDAIVVTAMAEESAAFQDRADVVGQAIQVGHALHQLLVLDGRTVLLVQCGIGLVNATAAVAVALTSATPRAVFSAGSAGGLGADVRVGDVVVGSTYVYSGADARAFGYVLGQVPGMPAVYHGDEALLDAAVHANLPQEVAEPALRVLSGTMLAGDAFVDSGMVDGLRASFPTALSTDMESTALAQTCHLYDVPFLSVRGISDLCGPAADADFLQHVDDAAERSASVVIGALHRVVALP